MVPTVLIAASEHLAALQQHSELTDAQAFADSDALKALDAISRQRPDLIALEKVFAASARGAAFLNRIKADPALAGCEIRIVEHDPSLARPAARRTDAVAAAAAPAEVANATASAVQVEPSPAPSRPPEVRTARAPRFDVTKQIEVMIDGNPATLVDISVVGAQVVSATSLRPNQRVRMSLLEKADRPIRFNGVIAWARFEIKGGPKYRAGVEFFDASPEAVTRFIDTVR